MEENKKTPQGVPVQEEFTKEIENLKAEVDFLKYELGFLQMEISSLKNC